MPQLQTIEITTLSAIEAELRVDSKKIVFQNEKLKIGKKHHFPILKHAAMNWGIPGLRD